MRQDLAIGRVLGDQRTSLRRSGIDEDGPLGGRLHRGVERREQDLGTLELQGECLGRHDERDAGALALLEARLKRVLTRSEVRIGVP